MPVVPKDFITRTRVRRRVALRSPRPRSYNTRDVFIMRKFTFLGKPVKRLYGPGGRLSRGRGMILSNRTLLHPPVHPASHRYVSPCVKFYFRCAISIPLTPFEVVRPRPCRIPFASGEIKRGHLSRISGRRKEGKKEEKREEKSDANTRGDRSGNTCKSVRSRILSERPFRGAQDARK